MTTVNLSCTICSEDYGANDEIISTYCGHIFHNSCFQDWRSRSSSCPQCRMQYIQAHRVYLHMEEPAQRRMPSELKIELENKISQLEHQLAESEGNVLQLQTTHCGKEEEISKLKTEIECQKAQVFDLKAKTAWQEMVNGSIKIEFSKAKLELQAQNKSLEKEISKLKAKIEWQEIENGRFKEKISKEKLELQAQNKSFEKEISELKTEIEFQKAENMRLEEKARIGVLARAKNLNLIKAVSDLKAKTEWQEIENGRFKEKFSKAKLELQAQKTEIECQKTQNMSLEEEFSKSELQLKDSERKLFDFLKLQTQNREEKLQEQKIEQEKTKLDLCTSEQAHLTPKDEFTLSEPEVIKLHNMSDMTVKNHQNNDKSNDQKKTSSELLLEEKYRVLEKKLDQMSVEMRRHDELVLESVRLILTLFGAL